ncbi:MAG: hypothetical protein P0Y65_05200 [Candidatus Devosia phytovorans]|uniref:Uncharacterized protein n=1 Tax=Candidatus Devosia phytovorans TaxID=3121372 RepID=A0AAJ5VVG7_9HYPH|nr:hypothetical protein [Devosia sp.]WEK05653.1 MAG: hypothetical protein P0Y65_05200 [Devosia sp.]
MAELSSHSAPQSGRPGPSSLGFNLASIAVLVLLLAVGAAYLVDELGRRDTVPPPSLTDSDPVQQTIAGRELSIPASWFRYGEQIRDGFTNQIDLRILFEVGDQDPAPVSVTLVPRSSARTSASLLDRVYLHQFDSDTLDGVPGLVGKPMQATEGYQGEAIWYDALSPNPFVAKCQAPLAPDAPAQCVRTVYLPSGIAAIYTFDTKLLQSWRDFDAEMEKWLSVIGAWS